MTARVVASNKVGQEEPQKRIWKRLAYATRYGKAGLLDAASMCADSLQSFLEAVSDIVEEENKPAKRRSR